MRRIIITFFTLAGIAALAVGGIDTAAHMTAGPAAGALLLVGAVVALVAVTLASRILFVLGNARTVRVPVDDEP
jgi:hypothetical protein